MKNHFGVDLTKVNMLLDSESMLLKETSKQSHNGADHQTTADCRTKQKNCLIIFARRSTWYRLIVGKFSQVYETHHFFADETFRIHGSIGIVERANHVIDDKHIDIVVFDCDFIPYIDCAVISKISNRVVKILITFDDLVMHDLNAVNAYACDMVLSADPISVLKYREKGITSDYVSMEATREIYKPMALRKDIEILFFGSMEKDARKEYLDHLKKNGFAVKIVGGSMGYVSLEELVTLINRSKIVLNLSRTHTIREYRSFFKKCDCSLDRSLFQLKGRIFEVALCRTVCVSEYAPSIELLFKDNEVPMFKNESECLTLIKLFLNNKTLRNETAERAYNKVMTHYEDTVRMASIENVIQKINKVPKSVATTRYYRSYVTGFKLVKCLRTPSNLFKEIVFLHQNGIFSFWPRDLVNSVKSFLSILTSVVVNKLCSKYRTMVSIKRPDDSSSI